MELGRLYLLGFNLICVGALAFAGMGFFLVLRASVTPSVPPGPLPFNGTFFPLPQDDAIING